MTSSIISHFGITAIGAWLLDWVRKAIVSIILAFRNFTFRLTNLVIDPRPSARSCT